MGKEAKIRRSKTGYTSEAKQEYREAVWRELLDGKDASNLTVACMPSKNGLELDTIHDNGVRSVLAIDESAAVIASAEWREKYPDVKCYGSKVSRAAERIVKDGAIPEIVNLDLCNNLSTELIEEVTAFIGTIKPKRIAITIMKGRESKAISFFIGEETGEYPRADLLQHIINKTDCVYASKNKHVGEYINSRTPMMWVVFDIYYYEDGENVDYSCDDIKEIAGFIKKISDLEDKRIDLEYNAYELRKNHSDKEIHNPDMPIKKRTRLYDNLREQIYSMDKEYTAAEREIINIGGDLDDLAIRFLEETHFHPKYNLTARKIVMSVAIHYGFSPFRRSNDLRKRLTSLLRC